MTILFVSGDLMFGSQLSFAAQRAGATLLTAPHLAAVREKLSQATPRLALVDLNSVGKDLSEVVAALKGLTPPPHIIAYGPHVHEALLAEAQSLGCDRVLTRGQFNAQMAQIIGEFAGKQ